MKIHSIFLCVFLFCLFGFCAQQVSAQEGPVQIFKKLNTDVTGDGKEDNIVVFGEQKEQDFFKRIVIEVRTGSGQKHRIQQKGGLHPEIFVCDLNGDQLDDLFVSVPEDYGKNKAGTYIYFFNNDAIVELTAPDSPVIQTELLNDYKGKIIIEIQDKTETFILDLSDRASEYTELGLYQENGLLNESAELPVSPYSKFKPVRVKGGKYILKDSRVVSDLTNKNIIATVEVFWSLEEGGWVLKEVDVRDY